MPGVPLAAMRKDQATPPAAVVAEGTGMLGDPVLALVVRLLGPLVALETIIRNARRH